MSKKMFPCKGCAERVVGCHGSCEKYHEAEKIFKGIREARRIEGDVNQYTVGRIVKAKKKNNDRPMGQV